MQDQSEIDWRVYVFYVGCAGEAKIGSTRNISGREYALKWADANANTPADVSRGGMLASRCFASESDARTAERMCQDLLHQYVKNAPGAGGRCEWFVVDAKTAILAMHRAAEAHHIDIEIPKAMTDKIRRIMRGSRDRFGSMSHVIRELLAEAIEARGEVAA